MAKVCDRCGRVIDVVHGRVSIRRFFCYELCKNCSNDLKEWITAQKRRVTQIEKR